MDFVGDLTVCEIFITQIFPSPCRIHFIGRTQVNFKNKIIKIFVKSHPQNIASYKATESYCIYNNNVVIPRKLLLLQIGWRSRKLSSTTALHESSTVKSFKYTIPFIAFSVLLITFVQQVLWCFDRSKVTN